MSFKNYLINLKLSSSTINRYLSFEKELLTYFLSDERSELGAVVPVAQKKRAKKLKALNYNDLLSYFNTKKSNNLKRSTLVHLLNRIQHYYDYLGVENPLKDFRLKGSEKPSSMVFLSPAQLKQIAVCYHQNKRLSLWSKVGISLLIYQGLSTHELPLLRVEHLNLEQGEIRIPKSVLNSRILPLEAAQILNLMQLIGDKKNNDLLLDYQSSSHGQNRHLHWKDQIKRELKKHTIRLPFTNLQQLRASRIAHWIKELGILHAQYLAGHQHLSSTQNYQSQDHEQLRASFEQIHPLF
ncbi:site-specific integrase [Aureispira sp. CCB-QB1]|uniref:tyrosine-type recombinase/integrase n=1 Tax=Aureispira sp. CCB-QB1 TaxID=1313421 RepID=UPI0006991D5D|nr:site-specific integrase [Aureispira sp. CCB-QB1]